MFLRLSNSWDSHNRILHQSRQIILINNWDFRVPLSFVSLIGYRGLIFSQKVTCQNRMSLFWTQFSERLILFENKPVGFRFTGISISKHLFFQLRSRLVVQRLLVDFTHIHKLRKIHERPLLKILLNRWGKVWRLKHSVVKTLILRNNRGINRICLLDRGCCRIGR